MLRGTFLVIAKSTRSGIFMGYSLACLGIV